MRAANSPHVKLEGDDNYTRSFQRIVCMIKGGRIPSIREMSTDEFGLRSMEGIDQRDLRMSSKMWEKRVLVQWVNLLNTLQYMELIFQTMKMHNP